MASDSPDRGVLTFVVSRDSVLQHLFRVGMRTTDSFQLVPQIACSFTPDPVAAPDDIRRVDLCDIGVTNGKHVFTVNASIGEGGDHLHVNFSKRGLPVINVSIDVKKPRYIHAMENVATVHDYLRLIRFTRDFDDGRIWSTNI